MPKKKTFIILQSHLNWYPEYSTLRYYEKMGAFKKDQRAEAYNKVFDKLASKKKL